MKKAPAFFSRLIELGITIHCHPGGQFSYVKDEDLKSVLGDEWERFCKLFGVQTCPIEGIYAWDAESVLERMRSGKLQGSQLYFD